MSLRTVEPGDLHEGEEFMMSFSLSDEGEVRLSDLGEVTGKLFEKIYPVLYKAKQQAGAGIEEPVKSAAVYIRTAVEKERNRLKGRMRTRRA